MRAANETINRYCDPVPGYAVPSWRQARLAVRTLAERDRRDHDGQFRVDDSEDPTTARDLLVDLRELSRVPRCPRLKPEIDRALNG